MQVFMMSLARDEFLALVAVLCQEWLGPWIPCKHILPEHFEQALPAICCS